MTDDVRADPWAPRSTRAVAAVTGSVLAAVAVVGAAAWLGSGGERPLPAVAASTTPVPLTSSSTTTLPTTTTVPARTCATVDHAFAPRVVAVPGVTRGARVVTPPRDADGVPGVPPLTSDGKAEFAWDRAAGTRPGGPAGNVLLNAHTWPDGTALGNRLLAALHRGDRVVVRGAHDRLCYRVTHRVQVPANRGFPRYYARSGPPQLAIVVCSGRRLGPGVWTHRTVWFASPSV